MIVIQGVGHYFYRIGAETALPSIEERLRAVCREKFRRLDRFIELALLGSGECVAGRALAPDCGLYISSGIGPIGTNITVQDAVSRDAKLPMPFNFVNTLGSSTGYYVGKNLGLTGESVFVSRRGGSFRAALTCAIGDLTAGVVSQALIGAVEECPLPAQRVRDLLALPAGAITAEGSHWLLLASDAGASADVAPHDVDTGEFRGYESADAATITAFAQRNSLRRLELSIAESGLPRLSMA